MIYCVHIIIYCVHISIYYVHIIIVNFFSEHVLISDVYPGKLTDSVPVDFGLRLWSLPPPSPREQILFVHAGTPLFKHLEVFLSSEPFFNLFFYQPSCRCWKLGTLLSFPVVTSTPHRSTGSPLAAATSHKVDPLEQLHSVSLPPVFSIHLAPSWQLPPACTWHSLLVQPARPPVRHRQRLQPSGLQVSPVCLATPSLSWPQSRVWAFDELTRQKKAMMPIELEKSRIFDISLSGSTATCCISVATKRSRA